MNSNRWRRSELSKRQMQILAFVERHDGKPFKLRMVSPALGMWSQEVSRTLHTLRAMGLVDYSPSEHPPLLTDAGRRMLWPHATAIT